MRLNFILNGSSICMQGYIKQNCLLIKGRTTHIFRLHQMHDMQSAVTDDRRVCPSGNSTLQHAVCVGVIRFGLEDYPQTKN